LAALLADESPEIRRAAWRALQSATKEFSRAWTESELRFTVLHELQNRGLELRYAAGQLLDLDWQARDLRRFLHELAAEPRARLLRVTQLPDDVLRDALAACARGPGRPKKREGKVSRRTGVLRRPTKDEAVHRLLTELGLCENRGVEATKKELSRKRIDRELWLRLRGNSE
jgi:hypothetical protein